MLNINLMVQYLDDHGDAVTAISTIFIAISSLIISIKTLGFLAAQQRHHESSIMPHLEVTNAMPTNLKERHGLHLKNFGTGPARSIRYSFTLDGEVITEKNEFIKKFKELFFKQLYDEGFSSDILPPKLIGTYFVPALFPNGSELILWLCSENETKWNFNDKKNEADLIAAFHRSLSKVGIEILYLTPHNKALKYTEKEGGLTSH